MKRRFKDETLNAIYEQWVKATPEQVKKILSPGSNREHEFKMGYKQVDLKHAPNRKMPIYAVFIAGREWKKRNPNVDHPVCPPLLKGKI